MLFRSRKENARHFAPVGWGRINNSASAARSSDDSASSASATRATELSGLIDVLVQGWVRGELAAPVTLVLSKAWNDRRLPSKLIVAGSSPVARSYEPCCMPLLNHAPDSAYR